MHVWTITSGCSVNTIHYWIISILIFTHIICEQCIWESLQASRCLKWHCAVALRSLLSRTDKGTSTCIQISHEECNICVHYSYTSRHLLTLTPSPSPGTPPPPPPSLLLPYLVFPQGLCGCILISAIVLVSCNACLLVHPSVCLVGILVVLQVMVCK